MAARPDRLMLLDTASLYFRAFFGVPDMRSPDGTPVNAVRGLLDFIATLVDRYEPTDLVCCWDDDWRPAWRVSLIPSYKGHRVVVVRAEDVDLEETPDALEVQIPIIREVLGALNIRIIGAAHHEADDVIGTLATKAQVPVDVVTGDRDLFQLVDDSRAVRILYVARGVGRAESVTDKVVATKYGVLPEQYVDFAVLRGDPSDGLPGVKGVGDKTAASLMQQYGDLDSIVAAAADPSSKLATGVRAKLLDATDYLAVAPDVVRVVRDLDITADDAALRPPDADTRADLEAIGKEYGLGGAMTRVLEALAKTAE